MSISQEAAKNHKILDQFFCFSVTAVTSLYCKPNICPPFLGLCCLSTQWPFFRDYATQAQQYPFVLGTVFTAHLTSRLPTGVLRRGPTSHLLGWFSTSQTTAEKPLLSAESSERLLSYPSAISLAARLKVTRSGDFGVALRRSIAGMPEYATLDKQERGAWTERWPGFLQPWLTAPRRIKRDKQLRISPIIRPNYLIC